MSETFYLNIMRPTNGLRTRFFPKSRIGQGLISMAPWVDLVLLIVFFVLIKGPQIQLGGVLIETAQRRAVTRWQGRSLGG